MFGGEAIIAGGEVLAQSTSGNFGYSVGRSLVFTYLPLDSLDRSDLEVEAFGERSSASVIDGAIYDPQRKKILC